MGEGSLHPHPKGWGIRDPPRSLCIKIMQEKGDARAGDILAMFMSFKTPKAFTSVDNMTNHFFNELIRSLKHSLSHQPNSHTYINILNKLELAKNSIDLKNEQIMDIIKEASLAIGSNFRKSILLIDNLDKSSHMQMEIVEKFLSGIQGFVEDTFAANKIELVIVGPLFWLERQEKISAEVSYISGSPIRMKKWTQEDISTLLSNRLQKYSTLKEFSLSRYFTPDAIEEIFLKTNGNPRYCMNAAHSCLFQGWENNVNVITSKFLVEHPHCVKGSIEAIEARAFFDLIRQIESDTSLKISYNKLSTLINSNKHLSIALLDNLFDIYNERKMEVRDIKYFRILYDNKFIQLDNSPNIPSTKKYFVLDSNIRRLFKVMLEAFDLNDRRTKNFIIQEFGL